MQNFLLFLSIAIIFTGCDPNCVSSPSCIGPPDGIFQEDEINLAVYENILEEVGENSYQSFALVDSIVIHVDNDVLSIVDFYHWEAIGGERSVTSIDFFYGEHTMNITFEDFVFENTESELKLVVT